jgi:hypothetical protein
MEILGDVLYFRSNQQAHFPDFAIVTCFFPPVLETGAVNGLGNKRLVHGLRLAVLLVVGLGPAWTAGLVWAGTVFEIGHPTTWKYLDTGQAPSAEWKGLYFDDTAWKAGPAPLGYGDSGMGTEVGWGTNPRQKYITTWFRHAFVCSGPQPGERFVLALCVGDGAVAYLDGAEVARFNLPAGQLGPQALATNSPSKDDEGFYMRLAVPTNWLRAGSNVLAVEVHQGAAAGRDIYLDAALKTVPFGSTPAVGRAARPAVEAYRHKHYLGPEVTIPDGFMDGGRGMDLDAQGRPHSGREILMVDRQRDKALARHLAFARSAELRALPPLQRAARLAAYIDHEATAPGGEKWDERTSNQLENELADQVVMIGEWFEQAHAGLCRHRALLFKVLGDESGLKTALLRGDYDNSDGAHTWNELFPGDGRRVLVDVMLDHDRQTFPDVSSPEVVVHYLRVNDKPWYRTKTRPN